MSSWDTDEQNKRVLSKRQRDEFVLTEREYKYTRISAGGVHLLLWST